MAGKSATAKKSSEVQKKTKAATKKNAAKSVKENVAKTIAKPIKSNPVRFDAPEESKVEDGTFLSLLSTRKDSLFETVMKLSSEASKVKAAVPAKSKTSDDDDFFDDDDDTDSDAEESEDEDDLDEDDWDDEEIELSQEHIQNATRFIDYLVEEKSLSFAKKPKPELIQSVARVLESFKGPTDKAEALSELLVDADEVEDVYISDERLADAIRKW